jgi:hypothetical protein
MEASSKAQSSLSLIAIVFFPEKLEANRIFISPLQSASAWHWHRSRGGKKNFITAGTANGSINLLSWSASKGFRLSFSINQISSHSSDFIRDEKPSTMSSLPRLSLHHSPFSSLVASTFTEIPLTALCDVN